MQLDTVTLPENLYWQDEFAWRSSAQSAQRTVGGGFVVESSPLQYGRPITLSGAWAKRTKVLELTDLQDAPDVKRTLTLADGTTHTVLFDLAKGGVQAPLLSPELNPTAETYYELTLNLITVEP